MVEKFQRTRRLADRIEQLLDEYEKKSDKTLLEEARKAAREIEAL